MSDRMLLKAVEHRHGGRATAYYRCVLEPEVLFHQLAIRKPSVLPAGASGDWQMHTRGEEFNYIIRGDRLPVSAKTAQQIHNGYAVPVLFALKVRIRA